MGRLSGRRSWAAVASAVVALTLAVPIPVAAFSGFANLTADSTYDTEMTFGVDLAGGAPDRLEILLDFMGSTSTFVAPVAPSGGHVTYRWDSSRNHVTPNTLVTYRWRATAKAKPDIAKGGRALRRRQPNQHQLAKHNGPRRWSVVEHAGLWRRLAVMA